MAVLPIIQPYGEGWDLRQPPTTRQLNFGGPVMQFVLAQNVEFGAMATIGGCERRGREVP